MIKSILTSTFIVSFALMSSASLAQSRTDFSGTWAFDKNKSDPGKGGSFLEGDEILAITQKSGSITLAKTLIRKGSEDFETSETHKFDGKEKIVKESLGTTKTSLQWSADKTILTITTIMTTVTGGVSTDYLVADSYKLSDKGRTLTIESLSKNPATGERTTKMVYSRR